MCLEVRLKSVVISDSAKVFRECVPKIGCTDGESGWAIVLLIICEDRGETDRFRTKRRERSADGEKIR